MTKNCIISKLAVLVYCKLFMLLPHSSAALTGKQTCHHSLLLSCTSTTVRVILVTFNIHNYILLQAFIQW